MLYNDWEKMKISDNTEQNRQIDKLRKSWEEKDTLNAQLLSYDKIIREMKLSNDLAIKQADEAKKSARKADIISIVSIIVSSVCSFLALAISVMGLVFGIN